MRGQTEIFLTYPEEDQLGGRTLRLKDVGQAAWKRSSEYTHAGAALREARTISEKIPLTI